GAEASGPGLPKELADTEVLVNGVASPLLKVGESIRFIVPKGTKSLDMAEFKVRRVSTGQVLAYGRLYVTTVSPGVIYAGQNPDVQAQARAVNQDGSVNGASRAAGFNQELTVYLTGQGAFDGLPDDGVAPGGEVPVPGEIQAAILLTSTQSILASVLSSTLDPNEPGVWRVKIKVPQVPADGNYGFVIAYRSTESNRMTIGSSTVAVNPLVRLAK
ncbi:MAG: hypothetical protein HZB13_17420, partial [Acidobacteria bacterium]|nr:hypothetical protein [Acidobacteriota bacterium]